MHVQGSAKVRFLGCVIPPPGRNGEFTQPSNPYLYIHSSYSGEILVRSDNPLLCTQRQTLYATVVSEQVTGREMRRRLLLQDLHPALSAVALGRSFFGSETSASVV